MPIAKTARTSSLYDVKAGVAMVKRWLAEPKGKMEAVLASIRGENPLRRREQAWSRPSDSETLAALPKDQHLHRPPDTRRTIRRIATFLCQCLAPCEFLPGCFGRGTLPEPHPCLRESTLRNHQSERLHIRQGRTFPPRRSLRWRPLHPCRRRRDRHRKLGRV